MGMLLLSNSTWMVLGPHSIVLRRILKSHIGWTMGKWTMIKPCCLCVRREWDVPVAVKMWLHYSASKADFIWQSLGDVLMAIPLHLLKDTAQEVLLCAIWNFIASQELMCTPRQGTKWNTYPGLSIPLPLPPQKSSLPTAWIPNQCERKMPV